MIASDAKQIVKSILNKYGFDNKLKARGTNFPCTTCPGVSYYFNVTIIDWTPNPKSDDIKKEVKGHGILLTFLGDFIQS